MSDVTGASDSLIDIEHRAQFNVRLLVRTFGISMAALYFEILIIRYIGTEIRIFAYLKNVTLLAGFCGLGIGMVLAEIPHRLRNWIPWLFALIFLLARYSKLLGLTHIGFLSTSDNPVWGNMQLQWPPILLKVAFVVILATFFSVMMGFFIFLGGLIGTELKHCSQLEGYSANLAGSLAGMLLFTAMSFYNTAPAIWVLTGCLLVGPFVHRQRILVVVMLGVIILVVVPQHGTFWSPYYRIDFRAFPPPSGLQRVVAYELDVNHDYHQNAVDLSPEFVRQFPNYSPNKELSFYDVPYKMIGSPGDVLVVGAGTGNDVAAALRHGAKHVDAVEIDPTIAMLGRQYHPERPYDSGRVTVIVNDARAFFNRAQKKYDLVIFGLLDSHTLLSSFSSLRLDNYVYTVESFRRAKDLLNDNGSMFVAFASGRTFVTTRQFATLTAAAGSAPKVLVNGSGTGAVVLFVLGKAQAAQVSTMEDITSRLTKDAAGVPVTTDAWPFVYLPGRIIPIWTLLALVVVWICIKKTIRNTIGFGVFRDWKNAHFFLLGCGFLLLETNAISKLSLLFGSTWIVNAVVISAFLVMALAANLIVARFNMSMPVTYVCLVIALVVSSIIPYNRFTSSASAAVAAGFLIALPVFFSGLIFSSSFRDVASPSGILGMNMLGAALGGVLENLTMIGGSPAITVLALLVYLGSAFALNKVESRVPVSAAA